MDNPADYVKDLADGMPNANDPLCDEDIPDGCESTVLPSERCLRKRGSAQSNTLHETSTLTNDEAGGYYSGLNEYDGLHIGDFIYSHARCGSKGAAPT